MRLSVKILLILQPICPPDIGDGWSVVSALLVVVKHDRTLI